MGIKIKPLELLAFAASSLVSCGMVKGTIQKKIYFEDVENEIAFFLLFSMLAIGFFISSIDKKEKQK